MKTLFFLLVLVVSSSSQARSWTTEICLESANTYAREYYARWSRSKPCAEETFKLNSATSSPYQSRSDAVAFSYTYSMVCGGKAMSYEVSFGYSGAYCAILGE